MVSLWDFKGIYMGFTTYPERRQIDFSPSARLFPSPSNGVALTGNFGFPIFHVKIIKAE